MKPTIRTFRTIVLGIFLHQFLSLSAWAQELESDTLKLGEEISRSNLPPTVVFAQVVG